MSLRAKGRSNGHQSDDSSAIAEVVEPRCSDPLPIELQQKGMVVRQALLGTRIIVAMAPPLFP